MLSETPSLEAGPSGTGLPTPSCPPGLSCPHRPTSPTLDPHPDPTPRRPCPQELAEMPTASPASLRAQSSQGAPPPPPRPTAVTPRPPLGSAPARAPLLQPHSPDRPPRASASGTAPDPAPGPSAREAPESRPGPGQPPRPPLLRLRHRRSEPQTGNPPGPPSSPEPLLQLHKEPEPELPPPPARPPRARLSARPAGRHGRLRAARLWARGGN